MARQRKFPIPVTFKDIPYDKDRFVKWCMEQQGLSESSANQYAEAIKTAYLTLFNEDDPLFDNLKIVFTPNDIEEYPEEWRPYIDGSELLFDNLPAIEDEYCNLMDYCNEIECIDEYGEILLDTSDGNEAPLPKEEWLRVFKTYARYIKWRIVEIYEDNCFPPSLATVPALNAPPLIDKDFFDIPLKNEFKEYLRKLHKKQDPNWQPESKRRRDERKNTYQGESSTYTWISHLTKLYNLILIRRINIETLKNLEHSLIRRKRPKFTRIFDLLCKYIEWDKYDFPDGVITGQHIKALEHYFNFMKAYSENPILYKPNKYTREKNSNK